MRIAEPVTAHDEEFWIWQAIAHGAREIAIYAWYPMSSGFESNGYGLINLDGSVTARARAAGKIAQIVNHHASELLDAKPDRAEVAILYNRLSYMVGGSQSSLSKLGNAERDSLMGVHRAFSEENIPVDFVDAAGIAANRLGQYKILFLPFPVMLSRDVAQGVEHYVESGGTAVAEARLAWNDARGFASDTIPGFGLDRVFGAKEKLIRPSDHPRIAIDGSSGLAGAGFEEDLEPLPDARVLARFEDGAPAVVENAWGKGKAILAGSFLALAYQGTSNDSIKQFFLSLARSAGVAAPVTVMQPPTHQIEIRRLVGNRRQVVFVFNYASKPVDAKFSLNMPWQVREVRNLADDTPVPFQTESGKIAIHKHLAQNEIFVFRIQAR
jgi:beta-galactosidase